MNFNQTKKCILPWIHLNVESTGEVYPCCQSDTLVGSLGNVSQTSIKNIWNGKQFIKLRREMMSGKEPDFCKSCFESERLGARSKRIRENDIWKKYHHITDDEIVDTKIPYIDIRFNNICNLKCRTCGPWSSHSWSFEYKKLNWDLPQSTEILNASTDNLQDFLRENILNLEQIYFCGGEPIYMEEHYELLKMLIDSENFDVEIRYSTNLSDLKFKNHNVLDYWKHFNNVSIHASLDHIGERLEYIRNGCSWQKIHDNLLMLKEQNIDLKISPTVGVLNVLTIDQAYRTYVDQNFIDKNSFNVNVLETPSIYSTQSLHPFLKIVAKERIETLLKDYDMNVDTTKKFKYLLDYMFEKDTWEENKDKFISVTRQLDKSRNEDFLKTFPELEIHIL